MTTTTIENFRTICKGSRKIALDIMLKFGVDQVKIKRPRYVGKSVLYYRDGDLLGTLSMWNGKPTLIIPSFSPIYSGE